MTWLFYLSQKEGMLQLLERPGTQMVWGPPPPPHITVILLGFFYLF